MKAFQLAIPVLLGVLLAGWCQLSTTPIPLPPLKGSQGVVWTNNVKTVSCEATSYENVGTFGPVFGFYSHSRQSNFLLCIVGTGMSTARLCCDERRKPGMLATDALWGVNRINKENKWVEVQGGARISDLVQKLAEEGLALASQPSFTEMSVVGALQTASHGSFLSRGSLSSSVLSFDIIFPNATRNTITKQSHPELFPAVLSGMGMFGFIYHVRLRVVPLVPLHRLDYPLSFSDLNEVSLNTLWNSTHTHWLTLQFNPLCDQLIVRSAEPLNDTDPVKHSLQEATSNSLVSTYLSSPWSKHSMRFIQPFIALAGKQSTISGPIMQTACTLLGSASFVEPQHKAVLVSRAGGATTHVEYYIDRQHLARAILELRAALQLAHSSGLINFNGFVTITFVAKDEGPLLSPSFRYDSAAIEVTVIGGSNVRPALIKVVEDTLAPYQPLPHLGLYHNIPFKTLRERYGELRFRKFSRARLQVDPEGKHLNQWKKGYTVDLGPIY